MYRAVLQRHKVNQSHHEAMGKRGLKKIRK